MSWREAAAAALDAQAAALADALERLDDVHGVLEQLGRTGPCHEIRATAATLRGELKDLQGQARALRTGPTENGFSIAVTADHITRRMRGDR